MASVPVFTGVWTDWSRGYYLGSSVTLTSNSALTLTNFVAIFISTIAGGFAWSLAAYFLHQYSWRRFTDTEDGVRAQHRLVWRNNSEPFSAVFDLFAVWWAWKPWVLKRSRNRWGIPAWTMGTRVGPRVECLNRRTILAMSTPVFLGSGLFVASILSANIVYSGDRGADVLAARGPKGTCGIWKYNTSDTDPSARLRAYNTKIVRDTVASRAYARSCYSAEKQTFNPVSCSFYTVQSLPYDFRMLYNVCPFGQKSFNYGPCNATNNPGSLEMFSLMLDSHDHFGINARRQDRVKFQRNVTCSIINPHHYLNRTRGYDINKRLYLGYYLGPVGPPKAIHSFDFTYSYDPKTIEANVEYQLISVVRFADTTNEWHAVDDFRRADSDTILIFLASNSVRYIERVHDPFFLATYRDPFDNLHNAFNPVSLMGCIESYRICNPNAGGRCSKSSGLVRLKNEVQKLDFNPAQNVTAERIIALAANSNTHSNINSTGTNALKASDRLLGLISLGLPDDQWITEVQGWFESGLAKMQAYAVEYVANYADLGPFGYVDFVGHNQTLLAEFEKQCHSQKFKITNRYQTISLFGLVLIFAFGTVVSVAGFLYHRAILPLWRKSFAEPNFQRHRRTYGSESKFYQQFLIYWKGGHVNASRIVGEVPVYEQKEADLPEPVPIFDKHLNDELLQYNDYNPQHQAKYSVE